MKLYQAFPQPSPVMLGGRQYLALPLRVKHLAAIETFIASRVPNPAEAYRGRIAAAEGEERLILAAQAYLCSEGWPPKPETAAGEAILLTQDGLRLLLGCTVEPCMPLEESDFDHIACNISSDEYMDLWRLAYGVTLADDIAITIHRPDPDGRGGKNWGEIIYEITDGRPSEIVAVGEMFISQIMLINSRGKAGDGLVPTTNRDDRAARRRLFAEAARRNAEEKAGESDE